MHFNKCGSGLIGPNGLRTASLSYGVLVGLSGY